MRYTYNAVITDKVVIEISHSHQTCISNREHSVRSLTRFPELTYTSFQQ